MRFFENYIYILNNLVIYTFAFRYNLGSRAFPKAKYSVVCAEFPMGSKFYFSKQKIHFSLCIFSEKYFEYFTH